MKSREASLPPPRLIINADDFGYFDCVSRGILDAAQDGVVTATGVFANSPAFHKHVQWLDRMKEIDVGVHLNLSYGQPLTSSMQQECARWDGRFPAKFQLAFAILSGKITASQILEEWSAQIQRCHESGLRLRFINSHEHIHMLPPLYDVCLNLARSFNIRFIRESVPEWNGSTSVGTAVRNLALQIMKTANAARVKKISPKLIGLSKSGRLDLTYLRKVTQRLDAGTDYELMCHPGYYDPEEIRDSRLRSYHDWEAELELLRSNRLRDLLSDRGIQIVGYRELEIHPSNLNG